MSTLWQDLKYGLRMLARNSGVTLVMVLTLGLSIGAVTAIFSVVYGVLLRPLPYPKPSQIVSVSEVASDGHVMYFTDPNFNDLRASNHTLVGMAEYGAYGVATVIGPGGPARVGVAEVSQDFFPVMGVSLLRGRGFATDELHLGARPVALASYGYWREQLNGAADLSPFKLKIDNRFCSVVGVLPPGFSFPDSTDLWVPRELFEHLPSRTAHNWQVVARVRDGVSLAQARDDLSALARHLHQQYQPDIDMADASVTPLREALTTDVRPALLVLLGAVGFLLLVGCANVANLLLARAAARERELGIRAALGAGRGRLVRQFLAESLLLSLAGGAIGVLAALWDVNALVALAPPNLPRLEEVSINLPVLAFALGVSILVAAGLGVLTALRATSSDPQDALVEGSRGSAGSARSQRLGRVLVGGQLAVTLVLLSGAGLLGRSLLRVLSTGPGFRTENVVTLEFDLHRPASPTDVAGQQASFLNALLGRLRGIPGVREVGVTSDLPLGESNSGDGTFLIVNKQPRMEDFERLVHTVPTGYADYCVASEGYFKALGIPLVRGRLFEDRDTADAPHTAVINESLARATWPSQDPLGKTIEFGNVNGDLRLLTIVGIVGDVRDRSLERPAQPTVYANYRQCRANSGSFTVVMHADRAPAVALAAARDVLRDLDPEVVPRLRSFQEVVSASLQTRRFNLTLVGVFAAAALLLAAVGVYGVMAYWVAQRTREIGVRVALGAVPRDVLRLVLGKSLATVAIGVAVGMAGAFLLTRAMRSLLYGVSASDPITFGAVALTLAAVALIASYVPARRASHVDPMVALRHE